MAKATDSTLCTICEPPRKHARGAAHKFTKQNPPVSEAEMGSSQEPQVAEISPGLQAVGDTVGDPLPPAMSDPGDILSRIRAQTAARVARCRARKRDAAVALQAQAQASG